MRAVEGCLVLLCILSTGNVDVFGSRLLSSQQRFQPRSARGPSMRDVSGLGYRPRENTYFPDRPDRNNPMNSGTLGQFSPHYEEDQFAGRGGLTESEYVITPSYDNKAHENTRPHLSYSNHQGYPRDQRMFEPDGGFDIPTRRNRYSDSNRAEFERPFVLRDIEMGRYHEDKRKRTYDGHTGNVNIRLVADDGGRSGRRVYEDTYHSNFHPDINDRHYNERDDFDTNRYYRPEDKYAERFERRRQPPQSHEDKSRDNVSPNRYESSPLRPSRRQQKPITKRYKASGKTKCKTGETAPFSRSVRHYKMCTFDHFIVRQCAPGTEFCADLGICCEKETLSEDRYELDSRMSGYNGDETDYNVKAYGDGGGGDDDVDKGDVYEQFRENRGQMDLSSKYSDIGVLKKDIHITKEPGTTMKYKKGYSMGTVQKGTEDKETVAQGPESDGNIAETPVKVISLEGYQEASNNIYTDEDMTPSYDKTDPEVNQSSPMPLLNP